MIIVDRQENLPIKAKEGTFALDLKSKTIYYFYGGWQIADYYYGNTLDTEAIRKTNWIVAELNMDTTL